MPVSVGMYAKSYDNIKTRLDALQLDIDVIPFNLDGKYLINGRETDPADLAVTRIGSWRIMLSMVLGAAFMSIVLNIISVQYGAELTNPFISVPWYYQFLLGSVFFAMAFMATDPVTASGTSTGKWVYGFLIGVVGIIIRVLNPAYPEGWMLAILLLNVFAPLIDHVVLQQNIKRRLRRVKV